MCIVGWARGYPHIVLLLFAVVTFGETHWLSIQIMFVVFLLYPCGVAPTTIIAKALVVYVSVSLPLQRFWHRAILSDKKFSTPQYILKELLNPSHLYRPSEIPIFIFKDQPPF
jgi:hypothetical protein